MAAKMQLEFRFKKQVPADYEDLKDVLAKRLKVQVRKEKAKGKALIFIVKAKDPGAVTKESIMPLLKRTAHRKEVKSVTVLA